MFGRRRTPEVVRALVLEPGERRLAWGLTVAGEAVVATDAGLYLPHVPRLAWHEVEKATWKRPLLELLRVGTISGTGARWQVPLADEGMLPDVVRSQVTASVAWSTHVGLAPTGGVRIVGRRRAGQDALDWQLVYDRGTDPDDPAVCAQAEALLLDARRTLG